MTPRKRRMGATSGFRGFYRGDCTSSRLPATLFRRGSPPAGGGKPDKTTGESLPLATLPPPVVCWSVPPTVAVLGLGVTACRSLVLPEPCKPLGRGHFLPVVLPPLPSRSLFFLPRMPTNHIRNPSQRTRARQLTRSSHLTRTPCSTPVSYPTRSPTSTPTRHRRIGHPRIDRPDTWRPTRRRTPWSGGSWSIINIWYRASRGVPRSSVRARKV